jgi:hypothetical protein
MKKILPLVLAVAFGGCAGQPTDKTGVAAGDEYESVTPLGSNIPVLVKKGTKPATASPTDTVSADQAANAIHGGGGQFSTPAGQKP